MSYIRCESNPEGLYVWGDANNYLTFIWKRNYPLAQGGNTFEIDKDLFHKAAMRWHGCDFDEESLDGVFDSVTEEGFCAKECFVFDDELASPDSPKRLVVKISYKDVSLCLWPVTWDYLVNDVVKRELWDKND